MSLSRDRKWYLVWELMLVEKGRHRVARWRHSSGMFNSIFVLVDKTVMRQTKWGHAKKSGQDQGVFRPEGQPGDLKRDYAVVVNSLNGLGGACVVHCRPFLKMEMPTTNDVKVIVDGGTKMVDHAPAPARGGGYVHCPPAGRRFLIRIGSRRLSKNPPGGYRRGWWLVGGSRGVEYDR